MNPPASFLFDRQSSTAAPSPEAVSAWAASQRVFVSSLIVDLRDERTQVRRAIQSVGGVPVMFEYDLGGQDVPADRAYLEGVRESGIYVGIFGPRYGIRLASGRSATHDELVEAEALGLRLCIFTGGDVSTIDREQSDIIAGLRNLYTTASFTDPDDLGRRVETRLRDLAAEVLLPWVRVGDLLIRATSISVAGSSIGISASIADREILARLQQWAERRESGLPFATHLVASDVQVAQLSTNTTNSAFTDVTLTLERRESRRSGFDGFGSINGIPAEEIQRRRLSDGLFGTSELPADRFGFGGPVDPLESLRGARIGEHAIRGIAQLLLSEYLLREGYASSVAPIDLGPSHQGRRALRLTWQPPQRYTNEPAPSPVTMTGTIEGV